MPTQINPKETTRAMAYDLWMKAPNPMVTFFKTLDVTNLIKISRKRNLKFNMLLDYCIGKAATQIKEFYILPVGDKLIQYDTIAVNTIVKNKDGEVSSCDILYTDDLSAFNHDYLTYTKQVAETCQDYDLSENAMVIGTSAIVDTASRNDSYVAILANMEIVVNKLFKTCLSDENGDVNTFLLCAGLDININSRLSVRLGYNIDIRRRFSA